MLNRHDFRNAQSNPQEILSQYEDPGADLDALKSVREIIADVKHRGDEAIFELGKKFDGSEPKPLKVSKAELQAAAARIDPKVLQALVEAADSVSSFYASTPSGDHDHVHRGVSVDARRVPVKRAGCYVPGGRAAYPSTVLMTALVAKQAGVKETVVCVPPNKDGQIEDVTLAAAYVCEIDEVYAVGGAQAIAAMAYGTQTVQAVDVIVGPGNRYVAIAKREVSGQVAVPSAFAGPSEICVIADASANPMFVAVDLLVQIEHGPDGKAWLITDSAELITEVDKAIEELLSGAQRRLDIEASLKTGGMAALVNNLEEALELSELIAPEHLQFMCQGAEELATRIENAAAVFVGDLSPAALGDYSAGPSHVLPTSATARFSGALCVDDFCKHVHVVTASPQGISDLGPVAQEIALAEGLGIHAQALQMRTDAVAAHRQAASENKCGSPNETSDATSFEDVSWRPAVSEHLSRLEGYHSPQLDVSVRLNTNESPIGPPKEFCEAIASAATHISWNRYPDRSATELREALASHYNEALNLPVPFGPENVYVANGSNEVLQNLVLTWAAMGRKVLSFEPTYAMHGQIARVCGAEIIEVERNENFEIDIEAACEAIETHRPAVTFVCSPNNPTGLLSDHHDIKRLAEAVRGIGLLVVDEAYGQFSHQSALELVAENQPLVVSRTFSKTWAMASARLGYLIGPSWAIQDLELATLPYHLDSFTQKTGLIALRYSTEMAERIELLKAQRNYLIANLNRLGLHCWESAANFVLFRCDSPDAETVWQGLVDAGVLIRNCSSWPRLQGCLRVTVGTEEENRVFIAALENLL